MAYLNVVQLKNMNLLGPIWISHVWNFGPTYPHFANEMQVLLLKIDFEHFLIVLEPQLWFELDLSNEVLHFDFCVINSSFLFQIMVILSQMERQNPVSEKYSYEFINILHWLFFYSSLFFLVALSKIKFSPQKRTRVNNFFTFGASFARFLVQTK